MTWLTNSRGTLIQATLLPLPTAAGEGERGDKGG
jgi:hypothetical protein